MCLSLEHHGPVNNIRALLAEIINYFALIQNTLHILTAERKEHKMWVG